MKLSVISGSAIGPGELRTSNFLRRTGNFSGPTSIKTKDELFGSSFISLSGPGAPMTYARREIVNNEEVSIYEGKASISPDLAPVLERLDIAPEEWVETTKSLTRKFRRVVGPAERIVEAAAAAQKNWFQGITFARRFFQEPSRTSA
jgi:hypothetical protein